MFTGSSGPALLEAGTPKGDGRSPPRRPLPGRPAVMAPDRLEDLRARGSRAARRLLGIGGRRRRFERTVSMRLTARLRFHPARLSHRGGAAHRVDADFE